MTEKEPRRFKAMPAEPIRLCPYCSTYSTQEIARVQVWDICHNTCTWAEFLCYNCDRTFKVLI